MEDAITENDLFEFADAIGKAFGFVLGAALAEKEGLGTRAARIAFTDSLRDLFESDQFSENVGLVVGGIVAGLERHLAGPRDGLPLV